MNIGDKVALNAAGRECQAFSIKRYGEPGDGEIVRFAGTENPVVQFANRKTALSISPSFIQIKT